GDSIRVGKIPMPRGGRPSERRRIPCRENSHIAPLPGSSGGAALSLRCRTAPTLQAPIREPMKLHLPLPAAPLLLALALAACEAPPPDAAPAGSLALAEEEAPPPTRGLDSLFLERAYDRAAGLP